MTNESLPALLIYEHQRRAQKCCWCRLAAEMEKKSRHQISTKKVMCLCNSSGQEQHQSEWSRRNIEKWATNVVLLGKIGKSLTSRTLEQEMIIVTLKNVYFVYVPCGEYADSGCSQSAEFHIQSWTGHQMEFQSSPICLCASASALTAGAGLEGLGCVFGWISSSFSYSKNKKTKTKLLSSHPPPITTNVLVLWDPSRSKQTVTSACSPWRKGSQNLNIYGMQCETKIPLLLVLFFRGLFIAAAHVFLGCCPAKSDVSQTKSPCACVEILEPSFSVCAPASQSHATARMKYHLLFGLGCPLR